MLKRKFLYLGFFAAVLCLLAISFLSLNFKAHAAAPTSPAATTTVHAYIISTKTGPTFKSTAITTVLRNAFAFSNTTAAAQDVLYLGKVVATVPAHSSKSYTFTKSGKYTFSLKLNANAKLTVTVK